MLPCIGAVDVGSRVCASLVRATRAFCLLGFSVHLRRRGWTCMSTLHMRAAAICGVGRSRGGGHGLCAYSPPPLSLTRQPRLCTPSRVWQRRYRCSLLESGERASVHHSWSQGTTEERRRRQERLYRRPPRRSTAALPRCATHPCVLPCLYDALRMLIAGFSFLLPLSCLPHHYRFDPPLCCHAVYLHSTGSRRSDNVRGRAPLRAPPLPIRAPPARARDGTLSAHGCVCLSAPDIPLCVTALLFLVLSVRGSCSAAGKTSGRHFGSPSHKRPLAHPPIRTTKLSRRSTPSAPQCRRSAPRAPTFENRRSLHNRAR